MRALFLLFVLAACSHDTPRENPLDPDLTPAVSLAVAVDDTMGTATLTWSAYEGRAPFSHYLVLRQISDRVGVDTLATIAEAASATYTDSTVVNATAYTYRVSVVNAEGLEIPSGEQRVPAVGLPAVRMLRAEFDSRTASADVEWSAYTGPRFSNYELWRSTPNGSSLITRIDDAEQTAFSDSGLVGNTPYSYRVVVRTTLDEELSSDELGGSIHGLVDTWEIGGEPDAIHLYREPGDRMSALAVQPGSDAAGVQVYVFDTSGTLQERFSPFDVVPPFVGSNSLASLWHLPTATRLAVDDQGRRFFNFGQRGPMLIGLSADGSPIERTYELFEEEFVVPLVGDEAIVQGEIRLRGLDLTWGAFDNATVSQAGDTVFREDFSGFPEGELPAGRTGNWELISPIRSELGRIRPLGAEGVRVVSDAWEDFRLECDVYNLVDGFGIQIGGDTYSSFFLHINKDGRSTATLEWSFTPPVGSDASPRRESYTTDLPIDFLVSLNNGFPDGSRLGLEMVDGQLRASITQRTWWHGHTLNYAGQWGTLAFVDGTIVATANERAFSITPEGEGTRRQDLGSFVSETRAWTDADGRNWLGVCLPGLGQLRMGIVRIPSLWDRFVTTEIGPFVGKAGHALHAPVSFDVGPDGRIFVLDAGTGVNVLDVDGQFITSWTTEPILDGRTGSTPTSQDTQFPFLTGSTSIAVDHEGYVYVADATNARILKFAP